MGIVLQQCVEGDLGRVEQKGQRKKKRNKNYISTGMCCGDTFIIHAEEKVQDKQGKNAGLVMQSVVMKRK